MKLPAILSFLIVLLGAVFQSDLFVFIGTAGYVIVFSLPITILLISVASYFGFHPAQQAMVYLFPPRPAKTNG